jgi:hypothetical protein
MNAPTTALHLLCSSADRPRCRRDRRTRTFEKRASRPKSRCPNCETTVSWHRSCSAAMRPSCPTSRTRDRRINRYYDPATGQFLSIDPAVAETGQPYAAFGDNPINLTDPLGKIITCGPDACTGNAGSSGIAPPGGTVIAACTAACLTEPNDGQPTPVSPSLPDCAAYPGYCATLTQALASGNPAEIACLDGAANCTGPSEAVPTGTYSPPPPQPTPSPGFFGQIAGAFVSGYNSVNNALNDVPGVPQVSNFIQGQWNTVLGYATDTVNAAGGCLETGGLYAGNWETQAGPDAILPGWVVGCGTGIVNSVNDSGGTAFNPSS